MAGRELMQSQILEENRAQGAEDQALQNRVAKKAKKRAKAAGRGEKGSYSSLHND